MRRHSPDFILLTVVLCLVAIGLVMVYSSSMVWALQMVAGASPNYYFKRQLIFAGIGIVGMFFIMHFRYAGLKKLARPIYLLSLFSLMAVLIPGIGHTENSVRRWLGPSALHFQPSELALVGIVFYMAYIYEKHSAVVKTFWRGVFPPLLMVGLQFLLVIKEPDMGTAVLLLLSGLSVMFGAGIRKRHMVVVGVILSPIIAAFAWFESYRNTRLLLFLHAWDPKYTNLGGYQLQQSLIAIFHGGLWGQGLGRGIEPYLYLPVPYADFIFAIVIEELGLIGAAVVLGLFGILVWRGIRVSQLFPNRFGSLLALGISCMIGIGTLINVGAVIGLLPITGIPLPFISYGGTALIMKLLAMGIVLSLSRYTVDATELKQSPHLNRHAVVSLPLQGQDMHASPKVHAKKTTAKPR